jgi:hypothetical protein
MTISRFFKVLNHHRLLGLLGVLAVLLHVLVSINSDCLERIFGKTLSETVDLVITAVVIGFIVNFKSTMFFEVAQSAKVIDEITCNMPSNVLDHNSVCLLIIEKWLQDVSKSREPQLKPIYLRKILASQKRVSRNMRKLRKEHYYLLTNDQLALIHMLHDSAVNLTELITDFYVDRSSDDPKATIEGLFEKYKPESIKLKALLSFNTFDSWYQF